MCSANLLIKASSLSGIIVLWINNCNSSNMNDQSYCCSIFVIVLLSTVSILSTVLQGVTYDKLIFFAHQNEVCSTICSLGGLHRFGIKVALSINRGLFLSVRGIAGIHIVRWNGTCYRTEAGHGNLKEFCIKFLEFG